MLLKEAAERLADAIGQTVVEVTNRLTAVLIVLVALDGNAGKRRIAGDIVRLAQDAVASGEAALEKLAQLNLAARGGQRIEVHIMDVNVSLAVSLCKLRVDDAHLVELLGGFTAVLQHGAHGGIGVDVGVLALHVRIRRLGERDVLEGLDEARVHVTHAVALGAIEDVGLGRLHEARLDERLFHKVLNALDGGGSLDGAALQLRNYLVGDLVGLLAALHGRARLKRLLNRLGNLLLMELRGASVTLNDGGNNHGRPSCPSLPSSFPGPFPSADTKCSASPEFSAPRALPCVSWERPAGSAVPSTTFPLTFPFNNHKILWLLGF